jgi:hypothetical protein
VLSKEDKRVAMRLSPVVIVALGVAGLGCWKAESPQDPGGGVVCTAQYVYGLSVTVHDKATGQRLCDAEVVAVSGSYRETLQTYGPAASCDYTGAGERPGVYDIQVSRAGFQVGTAPAVRVGADECHVIPARVTVQLER